MKEEAISRWNRVIKLLGWGDVKSAKLWFIGLEESAAFESSRDFEALQKEDFSAYSGCLGAKTPIYVIMSKIILGLQGEINVL